ncbi:MAG TPA: MMPL family transporter, partial [Solirubrobacteraceae bacterium]|nr:MMPL family transporter [Solirubrobacteraceae bacterium]
MLNLIAAVANSHPRRLAAALAVVLLLGVLFGASATNKLDAHNDFSDPSSQSTHAREAIERATGAGPEAGVLVLVNEHAGGALRHAELVLHGDRTVASVAPPLASRNGGSVLLAATLRAGVDEHVAAEHLKALFAGDRSVQLGGNTIAMREVGAQASKDLGLAEALAFPLIALLALLIFRGVAALLPVAVGGTSVFAAFATLRLFNVAFALSVFALNLVIGLGLGLAVDYSLFLVSRFREELGAGADTRTAVRTTMTTAGRTVAYSAVTVALAMSSLVVFPLRFLQSMGIGGAITALIAAGVALTLLPAAFALAGDRLGRVRPGRPREGRWYSHAQRVLRHPAAIALITAAGLIALTLPALHTHWSGVDARVLPTSTSARRVEDALQREYPRSRSTPAFVAVRAGAGHGSEVSSYTRRLASIDGVAEVAVPRYVGRGTWQVNVVLAGEAIAAQAQRTISQIRAVPAPFVAEVGGSGAEFADQRAAIASSLPVALAILVCGTLLVLWLMTDSVVLPLMALAMNALTVGAATGLLVLVFQDGRLQGPLAYASQHGIEQSNYLVLAAIAFALSTDYGVFLFTRIKEARDHGQDARESVALGVQRTGRIVTAAAMLLAVAIGAFATSNVVFLKEIGIGAVAAVLLDAFVVRTLLVPALMGALGSWSWFSPRALHRLHALVAGRVPRSLPEHGRSWERC